MSALKQRIRIVAWVGLLSAGLLLVAAEVRHRTQHGRYTPQGWVPAGQSSDRVSMEILVEAEGFMARLEDDLARADDTALVQTMSFEGDAAGRRLAAALMASPARRRMLLVDSYSRLVISDRFRFFPKYWHNKEIRRELDETGRLIAALQTSGVHVKLTNPVDPLFIGFPARNHKKLVVIDQRVSYLGGINFCDHNFSWHDMMIRISNDEVAQFLTRDFLATWRGVDLREERDFHGLWLGLLDGQANEQSLAPVFRALDEAHRSIFVESGYISFPFFAALRKARARGVTVTLLTPELNNKPMVKDYLLWEARRAGIETRLYTGRMSHLKALLIDDTVLVVGSSNFDYLSTTVQQELVAVVTDERTVAEFKAQVLGPDMLQSKPCVAGRGSTAGGWLRFIGMRTAGRAAVGLNRVLRMLGGSPGPECATEWTG